MKMFAKRDKNGLLNTSKLEYLFILTICFVTTFLILIFAHPNSLTSPDECKYLYLGKCIVDGSDYYHGFPDGRPIIPSIIAFFFYLGFDIVAVRLLIPIIFMNLALVSTYALGKTLFGRKEAVIATVVIFTLPFFWQFGTAIYPEIPLTTFATLFLLFFYLGIEKDIKFLPISAIFISIALLIKISAILFLVSAFFYLLMRVREKYKLIFTKEFVISILLVPLIFLTVFSIFHLFMSANMDFSRLETAASVGSRFPQFLGLVYAPILVLMIFGISKEKRSIYLCLPILAFFVFWAVTGCFLSLRNFAPLYPIACILIAIGFFKLLNKYNKKFVCILFILLLAVSSVHAVHLYDYSKNRNWGITTLSDSVNELEGTGKVAIDHYETGYYLKASTDKDIIYAFGRSREILPFRIYYTYESIYYTYDIITDDWIQKNNIEYIILSIYSEQSRTESKDYYPSKFLMIKIPFIKKRNIYNKLPPSNYQFQSELYNSFENKYEKIEEICKENQKVFVIYKVQ